jgi:transitional endoplasmic reticulum ATPase
VLTLMLLFVMLVFFFSVVRAVGRSSRRQRELRERALREAQERQQDGVDTSPFAGMPFGSLFGEMMRGGGEWTRSMAYDPRTGEWVDVSAAAPEPEPEPDATARVDQGARRPAGPGRAPRGRRARPAAANPLSSLLGGGIGGGMGGQGGDFQVQPPDELTTFADVGGMEAIKHEVRDTVGLMLEHPDDAERYDIEWNGLLLHGPPGVGKTFFAEAIAGQYRLNFIHVSTGDLVSSLQGGSAQNIDKAFDTAIQNLPCLLFFDEFDSVAQRRGDTPDQESRRTVNQLLTALEAHRDERELLVVAASNEIEHLDPAVIRPGRFDRHIRVDLPDAPARRAIFEAELDERPTAPGIDLEELVRRTDGMTPATISKIVDSAALDVFKDAASSGKQLLLETQHLLAAIESLGGQDRPMVEHWTWDALVLPEPTKAQLRQLQAVIEDPESARRFGIDPPTGLLLAGPPGTGKTTVAKVLAAQARCSFYPVSGADVMSKWVGESEGNIRRLFERARENRPSIVFIDEIDAIAGRRGEVAVHDTQVNQLLAEIDGVAGQRGVFVIGASNRPDQIDPAMLRGGRLSRTIILGLPDEPGRLAILCLHTARMPTVGVRLAELARDTAGMSPADLKAACQEAGLAAMARDAVSVTHEDFDEALERLRSGATARESYV